MENSPDTIEFVLTHAFGKNYPTWINVNTTDIELSDDEKEILKDLIYDRDHYEIKLKLNRKLEFYGSHEK